MDVKQIKKILDDLGYDFDEEIGLDEVQYISMTTDGCLYPGKDIRFKFHQINNSGVLLVYKGYEDKYGDFISPSNIPSAFIDFSVINGFKINMHHKIEGSTILNGKVYKSIQDALLNAENGDLIKIEKDVYIKNKLTIDKNIRLDFGDNKLILPESDEYTLVIKNNSSVVIENGEFNIDGHFGIGVQPNCTLTINNGKFKAGSKNDYIIGSWGKTVINNGLFKGLYNVVNSFKGELEINGGSFSTMSMDYSNLYESEDVMADDASIVKISGGSFSKELKERFIKDGYKQTKNGGIYIVSKEVV